MTAEQTALGLIERLEKASGPSRALANEVLFAVGWTLHEEGNPENPSLRWDSPDESESFYDGDQPDPLASLDAALTLVGDNWWKIEAGCDGTFFASVGRWDVHTDKASRGEAWTAAKALCIAALKARGIK